MTFFEKLNVSIKKNNSLLCVGLDTDVKKIPHHLATQKNGILKFNREIIDATADLVCAYKPNIAFYESIGAQGLTILQKTISYIQTTYPEIPVILDAKRADIGSTSEQYAKAVFGFLNADSVTLYPYLGLDSSEPFLKNKDKGIIFLCRTSNPSASEFQDLIVISSGERDLVSNKISHSARNDKPVPLYAKIAEKVVRWDKQYHNCLMVVGATWPKQMREIREIAPDMFFLVPGIGSQGGDLEGTLRAGLRPDKSGLIINAGRSIIYADSSKDFTQRARAETIKLRDEINMFRS